MPRPRQTEREEVLSQTRQRLLQAAAPLGAVALVALFVFSMSYFVYGVPAWVTGFVEHLRGPAVPVFFLGEISREGWWSYFPVVFFLVAFFFVVFFFVALPALAASPSSSPFFLRGGNSKPWRPVSLSTSVAEKGRPKRLVKSSSSSVLPSRR